LNVIKTDFSFILFSQILDFAWIFGAFALWSFWHWVVMHGVAYLTLVNVGSMLCSAPSDPFEGPTYRLIGIAHQFVAVVVMGNLTSWVGQRKRMKCLNAKAAEKED
jgi:hypothetical protein